MSELLLNTIIDKLTMESQVVNAIREKVETLPDNTEALKDLNTQLASIQKNIGQMSFPETDFRQLSLDLNRSISILQQPVKNEVIHHHHISKLIWITTGLFLMLCLICSSWYITHDKLKNYIAADTKYRYLNLDSDTNLQKLLHFTDSLYNSNSKMRDDVIRIEEENKETAELQKQADEKQKEADALRLKADQQKK